MGSHPINLFFRFLLEMVVLVSTGMWGWYQSEHWGRFILAIGLPVGLAIIWATFAVPDDPSRSGNAPVVTPGVIRLAIEWAFFAFACWALYDLGMTNMSFAMAILVFIHYVLSYDRVRWLISK